MEATRSELATIFGTSAKQISVYLSDGMPHNGKPGKASRYPVAECVQWLIDRRVEQATRNLKPQSAHDLEASKAEKEYWSAIRVKNLALREDGILITLNDAETQMVTRLTQIRDVLMTIENKWAPFLVAKDTLADAQEALREQVEQMMRTLSSLPDDDDLDDDDPITELEADIPLHDPDTDLITEEFDDLTDY